jgi:uncharacterized protein (TIGR02996 family)
MTPHDAFLQEILAAPDDDIPRLIYADWLEERGDPRGEFIRVQCALASMAETEPQRVLLAARAKELLTAHEPAWRMRLPNLQGLSWGPFKRGFVASVEAGNWQALRKHATAIFAAAPVRHLQFRQLTGRTTGALLKSPLLKRVNSVSLKDHRLGIEGAIAIAESPHLANLTCLDVSGNNIRKPGLEALAASPHLGKLTALYLSRNHLDPAGVVALATSPHLERLTTLSLSHNALGNAGVAALAAGASMSNLNTLFLSSNRIEDEGVKALATSPYLAKLTTLDLHNNDIGLLGVQAIVATTLLGRLTSLDLTDNNITLKIQPMLTARFGDGVRF